MGDKAEERTAAREYLLARLAICRGALALACNSVDEVLHHFVYPAADIKGKERAELMETADEAIGEAARALQLAQATMEDIDPREGEPDEEDEDADDDEEDEEDEDED